MANPWDADEIVSGNPWDQDEIIAPAKKPQTKRASGRNVELTGRAVARGVGSAVDQLDRGFSMLPGASLVTTARRYMPDISARQLADYGMTQAGVASPETQGERIASDVGEAVTHNLATLGTGTLAKVPMLAANPALQLLGTTGGSAAQSGAREAGASQGVQTAAGLVGGLLPGAARYGGPATIRGLLRGGEAGRQNVMDAIATFEQAGTTPTVGQATGGRIPRALEALLSRTPGGAGVITRKAEQQAAELGNKANSIADELSPGADPVEAGQAIERGIRGPNGYEARKGRLMSLLYDRVDQHIPQSERVPVTNTLTALRKQTQGIAGAPATSARLRNDELSNILDALEADAGPQQQIPYAALKGVRTELGHKVADASYGNSSIPKRQLSAAYRGMTDDMSAAARAQGPAAERALERANTHYAKGAARTEQIASVLNAGAPEKIYRAAMAGTEGGATQLEALMKSLPRESQQTVAAAVIKRMGKATNGNQNEVGDAFSSQTFLTNWNKLSPQAKNALFGRLPRQMQDELQSIAKVGANVRDGSKIYANPSGTAAAVTQGVGATSALTALLTGNPYVAGGVAASAGTANMLARLATNPRSSQFLSRRTTLPLGVANVPAYLLPGEQPK